MTRRRKGKPVHGWLVLDKPAGMTSTQAVGAVRRAFGAQKAGHAGTLDPLATGILPIALGEATKTVPYAVDGQKEYRFAVRWGVETDTDDAEGRPVATGDIRPERAAIEALLPGFTGEILQTPPAYSAVKIDGERAYDLARAGETVELEARPVQIDSLVLVDAPDRDTGVFAAQCGKGTYVRSLARDMGRDLGCFGHIAELRRVEVEPFTPDDFVTVAELEAARFGEKNDDKSDEMDAPIDFSAIDALLVDTAVALDCLPQVAVSDDAATKIRLGNPVIIRGRDAPVEAEEACATARGKLVAIGAIEQGMFKPKRVFVG